MGKISEEWISLSRHREQPRQPDAVGFDELALREDLDGEGARALSHHEPLEPLHVDGA
ncbi:MAG: hypothetical protein ACI9KE_005334, partial [Polyangiales bacterium]